MAAGVGWSRRRRATKRGIDLILATVLVLPAVLAMLVLGTAMAVSLRTWPFFTQVRLGLDGKPFRFLKIRTLPPTTPAYANKYELRNVDTTRLGRKLRRTHLDEVPQVLLVLIGKMSFVGPRPEMPILAAQWTPDFARARQSVPVGITGLWQIGEDSGRLIHECPEWDLFYVENGRAGLDLWILARTLGMMVQARKRVEWMAIDGLGRPAGSSRIGLDGDCIRLQRQVAAEQLQH